MYNDWDKIFKSGTKLHIEDLSIREYDDLWGCSCTVSDCKYEKKRGKWYVSFSYGTTQYKKQTKKILNHFINNRKVKVIYIEHVDEGWSYIKAFNAGRLTYICRVRLDV